MGLVGAIAKHLLHNRCHLNAFAARDTRVQRSRALATLYLARVSFKLIKLVGFKGTRSTHTNTSGGPPRAPLAPLWGSGGPCDPPRAPTWGPWGLVGGHGGPLVGVRDPHPYNASILDHHSLDRHPSSSPQILPTCSQLLAA